MKVYAVEVVALDAWMGNPNDPLLWRFTIPAMSEAAALAAMSRCYPGKKMRIVPVI